LNYKHGIYPGENSSPTTTPAKSKTVQVVIGTAPVHLTADPKVNVPILAHTLEEAKKHLGYSKDFDNFTLCAAMKVTFEIYKVAPVVFINVLDPAKHKTSTTKKELAVTALKAVSEVGGIITSTVKVKNSDGSKTYVKDTDYTLAYNEDGLLEVTIIADGQAKDETSIFLDYSFVDITKVSDSDVIGAYEAATNSYTGIEVINQIYPMFSVVPSIISAPGFSHKNNIARALEAKAANINECFEAFCFLDVDPSLRDHTQVEAWKLANGYKSEFAYLSYLKYKKDGVIYWASTHNAAIMQKADAENSDVPSLSISNRGLQIDATVFDDGTEIYLEQSQANILNGAGIGTAINQAGFKTWGNNTTAYPEKTEVKKRFVMSRRMFSYIGNTFITNFTEFVDRAIDYRLIEHVVVKENMRLNSLKAQGFIAEGSIEFREDDNPLETILDGKIQFITKLSTNVPGKEWINILEFNPNGILANLGGE